MNQNLKIYFSFLMIVLANLGCQKPPEWPVEPELLGFAYKSFSDETYIYHPLKEFPDTIILSVNFQDGDANLGLDIDDTLSPYNSFDYLIGDDGGRIKIKPNTQFNIYEHATEMNPDTNIIDTVLISNNIYKNNFLVDFLEYDASGKFIDTFNFKNPPFPDYPIIGIPRLDGRFIPLYKKDFSENIYDGPLEGTISYTMSSFNFPKGIWKISVRIVDRDLNVSNAILSPRITIK